MNHPKNTRGRAAYYHSDWLMKSFITFTSLVVLCTGSLASSSICASYASDLNAMVQVDQALRGRVSYDATPLGKMKESELPKVFQQMAIVDRVNTARLEKLVQTCGWPKNSVYGQQAARDAWMLVQHAEPEAQRRFLPLVEAAVKAGEASPSHLAYLADRVASREGRPQLYGTQFDQKGPCEFEFSPLDDRTKVNERRKSVGMPSLEEYERMFREYLSTRGCTSK